MSALCPLHVGPVAMLQPAWSSWCSFLYRFHPIQTLLPDPDRLFSVWPQCHGHVVPTSIRAGKMLASAAPPLHVGSAPLPSPWPAGANFGGDPIMTTCMHHSSWIPMRIRASMRIVQLHPFQHVCQRGISRRTRVPIEVLLKVVPRHGLLGAELQPSGLTHSTIEPRAARVLAMATFRKHLGKFPSLCHEAIMVISPSILYMYIG